MAPRRRRFFRLLASERSPWIAFALGLLLALPSLGVGLLNDDLLHRVMLENSDHELARSRFDLYDFTGRHAEWVRPGMDEGHLPWWTTDELSLIFFRPLSSLSLAADHALFGRAALPAHVHSLLWFALLAGFAVALLRRLVRPTAATLAALVYSLAGAHAMATSWLAARHTLIGAAFGMIALWAHVSWRQEGDGRRAWLAPSALVLGVLSSETALGAVVFIALYELIARVDRGSTRALATLPSLTIASAHLVFYVLSGYGAHASGVYIAPFADPLAFAMAAVERVPVLLGDLYGAAPSLLWASAEPSRPFLIGYGLIVTILVVALLLRARERLRRREQRRMLWLGVSSVVCLIPMIGGVLGGRLLPLALLGSSALLGTAMVRTWVDPRATGRARLATRGLVVVLALLHFGFSPLLRVSLAVELGRISGEHERLAAGARLEECPEEGHAYIVTGADPHLGYYAADALALYRPSERARFEHIRVLSMAPHDQSVRVLDDRSFELRTHVDERRANLFERVFREPPLEPGHVARAGELRAEVLEISPDGLWTRVRFTVDDSLGDVCFVRWDGERLVSARPPAPGEERAIPYHRGPMGL